MPETSAFVLTVPHVVEALAVIRRAPIHQTFAGYLAIKYALGRNNQTGSAPSDSFKPFFDKFLAVPGGPDGKPYLLPFNGNGRPTVLNAWFNKNVAGSYAPSSLRDVSPILRVLKVESDGRTATYTLVEDHARNAKQHLTSGKKVDALALAAVLYRDYSFSPGPLTLASLLKRFRFDFGFVSGIQSQGAAFDELFVVAEDDLQKSPFEPINGIAGGTSA